MQTRNKEMYEAFAKSVAVRAALISLTLFSLLPSLAFSDDNTPIPADKSHVEGWFKSNVGVLPTRKGSLDPQLVAAESEPPKIIKVRQDGSGDFKTINDAVKSIPANNAKRVIVDIGPGTYVEQVRIERSKKFVSFVGSGQMPTLKYALTALQGGVLESATLIVYSDYFSASNLNIVNGSPRPDGSRKLEQAVALRLVGDKAAIYNCKIIGFQDTLCDDKGRHFFKDCYIEGTVDFIFGSGKSLYLNTEIRVVEVKNGVIAAQARQSNSEDDGFSFVHCSITGKGTKAHLGRAWMPYPRVVYAYTTMEDVVLPEGWSDNNNHSRDKTVTFAEYKNVGPGSSTTARFPFTKHLSEAEAKPFLSLGFIEGSKWLLPPPKANKGHHRRTQQDVEQLEKPLPNSHSQNEKEEEYEAGGSRKGHKKNNGIDKHENQKGHHRLEQQDDRQQPEAPSPSSHDHNEKQKHENRPGNSKLGRRNYGH